MLTCAHCGETFERRRTGPPAKYCTATCKARASDQRARDDGRFTEWGAAARARRAKPMTKRPCRQCGAVFLTNHPGNVLCSDECRRLNFNAQANAIGHERRAKMRDADSERFRRDEIFKRDGYLCHLCGVLTDPDAPRYAPLKTTLDHVIPLAKGGTHTRDNVKCACLRCNVRKGDRMEVRALAGADSEEKRSETT